MANVAKTEKRSISQFLQIPATQKFLESNLKERKGEFISNVIALSESNAALKTCDPGDLMKCCLNATALNLPLNNNLGFAYVIPYKGVPSFQIGYKGLIQLAIRTGKYKHLNATEVREGEIERNKITGEINFLGEYRNNKVVGYIAYLELMTGFSASLYMSEDDIEKHAKRYSQMYKSDLKNKTRKSKWSDPEDRPKMAKKTVIKGLIGTYGVITSDIQAAIEKDSDHEVPQEPRGRSFEEAEIVEQQDPSETTEKKPEKKQNEQKTIDI